MVQSPIPHNQPADGIFSHAEREAAAVLAQTKQVNKTSSVDVEFFHSFQYVSTMFAASSKNWHIACLESSSHP